MINDDKTREELALEAACRVIAKFDGRTFDALSNNEKKRYLDRFEEGLDEYLRLS